VTRATSISPESGLLTVFTSELPAHLGKTFKMSEGRLVKETAGAMARGTYSTKSFADAAELRELLLSVGTNQAICASINDSDPQGLIVPSKHLPRLHGAASRTKSYFSFPRRRGVAIFDYDPPDVGRVLSAQELWSTLLRISPEAGSAGAVWWCSGSSHIFHHDVEEHGLRGQRIYLLVEDLSDSERMGEVLGKRLWLAGLGHIQVTKSGSRLPRCTFDLSMFQPARLDFIGGAVCEPPLYQNRPSPVILNEGAWLDTRKAFPNLNPPEELRFEAAVEARRIEAEAEARTARETWVAARKMDLVTQLKTSGMQFQEAEERAAQTLKSAVAGVLLGDFRVVLESGQEVTIADVLKQKDRYHSCLTLDPLEPEYQNRKVVGKLYLYGSSPVLFSFAHGGATYRLRPQVSRLYLTKGRKAELASEFVKLLSTEPDVFLSGGCLVQVVSGRVRQLKKPALLHLLGSRVALFVKKEGVDIPVDIPADVVEMVLGQVEG
jgi:hypothetical protein